MIKKIILITETRFTIRDYHRFGIAILRQNGFNVQIWDLCAVLRPRFFRDYVPPDLFQGEGVTIFDNEAKMRGALSKLSDADFVVNSVAYNFENLKVYKAISASRANYAVSYVNSLPLEKGRSNFMVAVLRKLYSMRYIEARRRLFMKLPFRWLGVRPASLALASGSRCFNYYFPISKKTETLQIHAFDYDLYLKEKGLPMGAAPTAVFLDQFIPFHPDCILVGIGPLMDADKYYKQLNTFFDLIERKSGLEVVIAAHPRSNYDKLPNYFMERKCVKGKTAGLIRECQMVIGHNTTAFNFAALFYKPAIFITSSDFDKTWPGYHVYKMAKCFGKKPVFIDKISDIDLKAEFEVNRPKYDNYRKAYIKTDGTKDLPFWQVFADRLKEEF